MRRVSRGARRDTRSFASATANGGAVWEVILSGKVRVPSRFSRNTLRALVQHLDGISEDEISNLNIPTGVPLVYELDDDLKPIPHPDAISPLQGHYLGDQEKVRARIEGVASQTK